MTSAVNPTTSKYETKLTVESHNSDMLRSTVTMKGDTQRIAQEDKEPFSCCGGLVEGQYVEPKRRDPTAEEIKNRRCRCLPVYIWKEFVYHRPQSFGFLLPFVWTCMWWIPVMSYTNGFEYYGSEDKSIDALVGWPFALMMIFGSLVAGGTSEGGGAVAYPVMTLVFDLTSYVARDFSLMIQSVGMTAAAFSIVYSKIQIEPTAVIWTNLGGVPGCILGILFVSPHIPGDSSKMLFVGVWSTFAFSLWLLNRKEERRVFLEIQNVDMWTRTILFVVGFVGGIFTSIAGSGIDIMSFSVLTLMFRISEKSATPTSVILMGCNTVVGFLTQLLVSSYVLPDDVQADIIPQLSNATITLCADAGDGGCIASQTWRYFLCAAIVVPCGAPMGAYLASFLNRIVYAYVVYGFNCIQLIMAFVIVQQTAGTCTIFALAVVGAGITFFAFARVGDRFLDRLGAAEKEGPEDAAQSNGDFASSEGDASNRAKKRPKAVGMSSIAPVHGDVP